MILTGVPNFLTECFRRWPDEEITMSSPKGSSINSDNSAYVPLVGQGSLGSLSPRHGSATPENCLIYDAR
jgi:hypothetical protein